MSAPPGALLFDGDTPEIGAPEPPPYLDGLDHLEDERALCALLFERLPAIARQRDGSATPTERDAQPGPEEQLRRTDARAAARRARIEGRIASSLRSGVTLPIVDLARRFRLDRVPHSIVTTLAVLELWPRLLVAATPSGSDRPPPFPSPALLYRLLAAGRQPAVSEARWMTCFVGRASLLDARLVERVDAAQPAVGIGGAPLRVNPRVLAFLLGRDDLDEAVRGTVRRLAPPPAQEHAEPRGDDLHGVLRGRAAVGHRVWLVGSAGAGATDVAARLACRSGRPLLDLSLERATALPPTARDELLAGWRLEQRLSDAATLIRWPGSGPDPVYRQRLLASLREVGEAAAGPVIVQSDEAAPELGAVLGAAVVHALGTPTVPERARLWKEGLAALGLHLAADQTTALAEDFALGSREIADIVESLRRGAVHGRRTSHADVRSACAASKRRGLGQLADVVVTSFAWDDLVLPSDELGRLREIVLFLQYRQQVLDDWNMAAKLPYGTGLAALFSGPPGTGKTMAAAVIANEIGRELHRIDLSRVVDKYIGETEKNLAAIFDAAADANAVLLFDEADSLFAKRTGVSSSHDRYANLETSFLLQRIEEYPGVAILTTNLAQGIDEAFIRRIQFRIEFPFPEADMRARIWQGSFPPEVPIDADVDFEELGARFELSGGHIKAAAVRAAFTAAGAGSPVTMDLLSRAALVECRALGKAVRMA